MNENYGPRYVKYSNKKAEHGFKEDDTYIGEWSIDTNKTHGRGIKFDSNYCFIGNFENGLSVGTGKFYAIYNEVVFSVGEFTVDANGKKHSKGVSYFTNGKHSKFYN